jgi:hypothetical protein
VTIKFQNVREHSLSLCKTNVTGLKYGMQAIKGTLSALIRKFKILPGSTPLSLDYRITLGSKSGMRVRLEPR